MRRLRRWIRLLIGLAPLALAGCGAGLSVDLRIPAGAPTPAITVPEGVDCIARTRIYRDGQWRKSYSFQRAGDSDCVKAAENFNAISTWPQAVHPSPSAAPTWRSFGPRH